MAPTPLTLANLKANPKNPRTITAAKRNQLSAALRRFGDLGGIVYNKTSGQLVGGHQRVAAFDPCAKVHITQTYAKPTATGTVAEGYAVCGQDRYAYREVAWDDDTERAANLAANKGAGEFDLQEVSAWLIDLQDQNFDIDLTMFDADERAGLLGEQAQDSAWDDALSRVPEGDQENIKTVTFTLSMDQHALVMQRLNAVKALGPFTDTGNANNNGNALARLAELYDG